MRINEILRLKVCSLYLDDDQYHYSTKYLALMMSRIEIYLIYLMMPRVDMYPIIDAMH